MSLAFFENEFGVVYMINSALNVVDATRFYEANRNFLGAFPDLRKPIRVSGQPIVLNVSAGHTNTPVLRYTPYSSANINHNRCFHPAAYVRCTDNIANLEVITQQMVFGKLVDIPITVRFPVNQKVAEAMNEAEYCTWSASPTEISLQIGKKFIIPCEIIVKGIDLP